MAPSIRKSNRTADKVPKMCKTKAWEVVYQPPLPAPLEDIAQKKFGLYAGFSVVHEESGKDHQHVGLALRDEPQDRSFTWGDALYEYFTIGGQKPQLVAPLKKRGKVAAKLQQYYNYAVDQEKHPGQTIGEPVLHKWEPEVIESGVNLTKCATKLYVYHLYKRGKSFREIFSDAPEWRQSEMMYDFGKIKKMLRNYDDFSTDLTVKHTIEEFNEEPVKAVLEDWDPAKEALILQGPSNAGKTELAKAVAKHVSTQQGVRSTDPLLVSNINKLVCQDPLQPIIYDDMNFSNISRSKGINLTDVENDRDIRILYGIHTIKAGTVRIFTTNEKVNELLPLFKDQHGAIERRFRLVNLERFGKLYTE